MGRCGAELVPSTVTLGGALWATLTVLAAMYWRSLPLAYHFQMLWYIPSELLRRRLSSVWEPTTLCLRVWPDNCNWNAHMVNSA